MYTGHISIKILKLKIFSIPCRNQNFSLILKMQRAYLDNLAEHERNSFGLNNVILIIHIIRRTSYQNLHVLNHHIFKLQFSLNKGSRKKSYFLKWAGH